MSHTAHPEHGHAPPHTHASPHPAADPADSDPKKSWALLAVALAAQILVVLDISVVNTALPSIGQRAAPRGQPAAVAGHRLPDDVRRRPAPRRPHRRPALPAPRVPDRADPVHRRLPGQRLRRQRQPAHRGPRRPGTQRRTAHPLRALADHDHLRRRPAQDRARHVGRRRQPRRRSRSPPRRRPDHLGELAGHLLDQRAHRRRRPARRPPASSPRTPHPDPACATSTSPAPWPSSAGSPPSSTGSPAPRPTAGGRSRPSTALAVSAVLLAAFLKLERRAAKPLFPPHIWKLQALVSGTAVMLGVTGILVGAVFLTSIFLQTVLGFSALETGLGVPAVRARHHRRHPGRQAPAGPPLAARHRDRRAAHHRRCLAVAVHRRQRRAPRHRHPPGAVRARARRRHGVRARLGDLHGRHPRLPRRRRLRVPDDRPRDRRRTRCRRPVRGRQQRRHPHHRSRCRRRVLGRVHRRRRHGRRLRGLRAAPDARDHASGGGGHMHMH